MGSLAPPPEFNAAAPLLFHSSATRVGLPVMAPPSLARVREGMAMTDRVDPAPK
jgi:hypothetical protein